MKLPEYIPLRALLRLPTWLNRFVGLRLLYAIALHCDAVLELFVRAVKLRYAGAYQVNGFTVYETLPLITREHVMIRGLHETDAQHAARLDGAWLAHADRGGPYQLLEQIWHHYRPSMFVCDLVYASGAHWSMNPTTGVITQDFVTFETAFPGEQWARWTLIYRWPTTIDDDGLWDDAGTWDDGGIWDYSLADLSAADVADLRAVPTAWNNAHCLGQILLLGPGEEIWDFPEAEWDAGSDAWDSPGDAPVVVEIR